MSTKPLHVFVVKWEHWDGCDIVGGDSYMSLDEFNAKEFMNDTARNDEHVDYVWDGSMWVSVIEHDDGAYDEMYKLYIEMIPLDKEL